MNQVYFKGKKRAFKFNTTTILILINIICFFIFGILILLKPNLIEYIALKPSNIFTNLYLWTFLTSIFMHGGFFHLFANMISLIFSGGLIEKIIGKKRFLIFYILAGLFSGLFFVLTSLIIKSDYSTYAVGASGAIFGLVGLLMILTPNLPVYIMFIPIPIKMKFAAPLMFIALWAISIGADIPIGNSAHFGGILAGIIYGFYLRKKFKNKIKSLNESFI